MAKDRHHTFVRALETSLKAIPWKIEIGFCVVTGLLVIFHKQLGAQPNAISLPSYLCGPFHTNKGCKISKCHGLLVL
jgi:hypothetical protein